MRSLDLSLDDAILRIERLSWRVVGIDGLFETGIKKLVGSLSLGATDNRSFPFFQAGIDSKCTYPSDGTST